MVVRSCIGWSENNLFKCGKRGGFQTTLKCLASVPFSRTSVTVPIASPTVVSRFYPPLIRRSPEFY